MRALAFYATCKLMIELYEGFEKKEKLNEAAVAIQCQIIDITFMVIIVCMFRDKK
jgi:high-affinity K+ transport system ATPase subunit B